MRSHAWRRIGELLTATMLAGLVLVPQPVWAAARKSKPASKADAAGAVCSTGGCSSAEGGHKLGTTLNWMDTPDAAARAAIDQGKLVFMIQVSGNFARQEFT